MRKILRILIIVLIVHIILQLIPLSKLTGYSVLEEQNITQDNLELQRTCNISELQWDYLWNGWEAARNNQISPIFYLINNDTKSGSFTIYYAFYDNATYPYDEYDGIDYSQVSHKLPWSAASMISRTETVYLESGQQARITIFTQKENASKTYWVYPNVTTSQHRECTNEVVVSQQGNVTLVEKTKYNKTTINLWQYIIRNINGEQVWK